MTNPHRRRRRRAHRAANPHRRRRHVIRHHRRRNPSVRIHRRHRRRRNPAMKTALMVGLGAAAGNVATRGLTQAFLGANNSGYVGIAANLGVAWGLSFVAEKLKLDGDIALGVLAGGVAGAAQRLYEMFVAPGASAALSGLGDPWYSGNGLGEYKSYSTFPTNAFPPALPAPNGAVQAGIV